jgi:Zn-dependent protease with chaperone function
MSSGAGAVPTLACPACGVAVHDDPRWVVWCEACDWNVAADLPPLPAGRWARLQHRALARAGTAMFTEMVSGRPSGPRIRALRVAAALLAVVILAGVVALAGLVVWVVIWGNSWWRWPCAVIGLGVLASLVRRPRQLPPGLMDVDRERFPRLWALVEQMAGELGIDPPTKVVVSLDMNMRVRAVGRRRRAVLEIGLPMWEYLSRTDRLMVLGHELGHLAHRDLRRSGYVYLARRSVATLVSLLWPDPHETRRRGLGHVTSGSDGQQFVTNAVRRALALPFLAVRWAMDRLLLSAGQHAEYRADLAAARFVGADAAAAALESMLGLPGAWVRAQSAVRRAEDPWAETARRVQPSEREQQRRLRADELVGHGIDDTHPPTYLRAELVRRLGGPDAALTLSDADWSGIEAELAAVRERSTKNYRDALLTRNF